MAFKMKGSPMHKGTASHASALEKDSMYKKASMLKRASAPNNSPILSKEYDAAAKNDPELGANVAARNKAKYVNGKDGEKIPGYKTSEAYLAPQSKVNQAYGINDAYSKREVKSEDKSEDTTRKTALGGTLEKTDTGSIRTNKDETRVVTKEKTDDGKSKIVETADETGGDLSVKRSKVTTGRSTKTKDDDTKTKTRVGKFGKNKGVVIEKKKTAGGRTKTFDGEARSTRKVDKSYRKYQKHADKSAAAGAEASRLVNEEEGWKGGRAGAKAGRKSVKELKQELKAEKDYDKCIDRGGDPTRRA